MLIIKKLTKQCTPCPSASMTILQKGIAISLEGRHLVLTLLASIRHTVLLDKLKCIPFPGLYRICISSSKVKNNSSLRLEIIDRP